MYSKEAVKATVTELRAALKPKTKADEEFFSGIEGLVEAWYEDGLPQEKIDKYVGILKGER